MGQEKEVETDHRLVTENVEEWLTCDSKGEALMVYQYGDAGIILFSRSTLALSPESIFVPFNLNARADQ